MCYHDKSSSVGSYAYEFVLSQIEFFCIELQKFSIQFN